MTKSETGTYQKRVDDWLLACFGETISRDREERNHRFIEEALELVQANGCTKSEAHQLVDYVYGRPEGDLFQEVGGVMNTLAALCLANDVDLDHAAEAELTRVWTKVDAIRAKQAAKPKHSPLPVPPSDVLSEDGESDAAFRHMVACCVAFVYWAAGEGIVGDPAHVTEPELIISDYCDVVGDVSDGIVGHVRERLSCRAVSPPAAFALEIVCRAICIFKGYDPDRTGDAADAGLPKDWPLWRVEEGLGTAVLAAMPALKPFPAPVPAGEAVEKVAKALWLLEPDRTEEQWLDAVQRRAATVKRAMEQACAALTAAQPRADASEVTEAEVDAFYKNAPSLRIERSELRRALRAARAALAAREPRS